MRPEFVSLDRTFDKYDPDQDQEGIAIRSYVKGSPGKWTWERLLDHGRAVVLGEAGSGKTYEFEAQAKQLTLTGKYAFFVRLEYLAENELRDILFGDDLTQFNVWFGSTAEAYFFLDAVDESRLKSFHAFEQALGNFARSLEPAMARTRVVISSRITEWRGITDSALVMQHLPTIPKKPPATSAKPNMTQMETADAFADSGAENFANEDGADNLPPVLVVVIAPLQEDQVRKFAAARIETSDAFVEAIKNRDVWDLARRPLDVEDLLAYWTERGGLGFLSEIQEFSVTKKLEEPNQRRTQDDPLSLERARDGAETLAAAVILAKQLSFVHPESGMTNTVNNPALDPTLILPTWKTGEIKTLFARPLFDGAAFEKVRFHHRRATEYLAACWFRRLVTANLPLVELHCFLFKDSHRLRVIPPSLAPIAAWLAGWFPSIRKAVMEADPDILLLHGDPNLIPLPERVVLLQKLIDQKARRLKSFDAAQFLRLADPSLVPYVTKVLSDSSFDENAQDLILDLIRHGRLTDCADAVLAVASDLTTSSNLRQAAVLTLKEVGNFQQLQALAVMALKYSSIASREARILCQVLYPRVLDEAGLEKLIRIAQSPDTLMGGWLDYTLKDTAQMISADRLPALMALLICLSREEPWVQGGTPQHPSKVSSRFLWVYKPLLATVQRILHTDGCAGLAPEQMAEAIERLSRLRRYDSRHSNGRKQMQDDLDAHPEVRRQLFWRRVDRLRHHHNNNSDDINRYHDFYDLWFLAERDITWLLEDVAMGATIKDRVLALRIALQVWRGSNRPPRIRRNICRVSWRERELRQAYRRGNPNVVKRAWHWTHGKIEHLRRFGLPYHLPRKVRIAWTRFRIFLDAIRHYHALRTKPPFWLLHNLILVDPDIHGLRYEEFDVSKISRRYGSIIGKAACEGLKIFWKQWSSPLPGDKLNTTYRSSVIALIGLKIVVRDGLNMALLSPEEAKIAAGHALCEMNGFPSWMPALAKAHPEIVRRVFRPQIEAEFRFSADAEGPHGLLADLRYEPDDIRLASAPDVLELLKLSDPSNLRVLTLALNILAQSGPTFRSELTLMVPARTIAATAAGREKHLIQWLALWLQLDALPALGFLDSHIADYSGNADEFVINLADLLHGDRMEHVAISDPDFRRLPALQRLIPILYRHIRPKDDLSHNGVYSPGARDHAQDLRSVAIRWLVDAPGDQVYATIMELADDLTLTTSRDWLLAKAAERAKVDAESSPWESKDIAAFIDRFECLPKTSDELFRIVMGRLEDIRENGERGDFSLKGMFDKNTKEEVFQKLLADRLDVVSRDIYQVAREVEVAERKLPDIRIFRAGAGIVTIEVKIADKWSYNQLRNDALEGQLVGQYMRIRESRHGILLLVNLKAGRTWRLSKGEPCINFTALVRRLEEEAGKLASSRGREEKINVIGIDLA